MRWRYPPEIVPFLGAGMLGFALLATWSQLPHRLATHFDFHGRPDAWASKEAYLVAVVTLAAVATATILGIFRLVGVATSTPAGSPSADANGRKVPSQRLWTFGCEVAGGLCLFLAQVHLLVVRANAASEPRLGYGIILVAGVFVIVIALRARALLGSSAVRPEAASPRRS